MPFQWTNPSDLEILTEQKVQPAYFIWKYFLRPNQKDKVKAKCSICKEVVTYKNNLAQLSLHLDRQHFLSTRRLREELQEDQRLEDVSYENDYWVKPLKGDVEYGACIICGVAREREEKVVISSKGDIVKQQVSYEKSVAEADKLLSVFKTVCKKIDVPLRCIQAWDFRHEDLPFCKHCTGIANSIYEKHVEMEKIEEQVRGLATNVKDLIWDTKDQFTQSSEIDQASLERTINFRSFVLDNFGREAMGDIEAAAEEQEDSPQEITIEDDETTNSTGKDGNGEENEANEENLGDDVEIVAQEPASTSKRSKRERPQDPIPMKRRSTRPTKRKKLSQIVDVESDEEYVPEISEKKLRKSKKQNVEPDSDPVRCISMGNNKFSYSGHEFQQIVGDNNKGSFICLSCPPGRTYTQRYGVISHIKVQHLNQTFMCFTCGASLSTISKLKQHEQNHLEGNQKRCICCECERTFTTTKHLKRHLLEIHRLRLNITCDSCGSLFRTETELREHCVDKHLDKRFFCDHCGQGLSDEDKLQEHKAVHANHKFFKCMHCSACFLQKENAKKHFVEKHNAFFEPLLSNNGNDAQTADALDSIDALLQ